MRCQNFANTLQPHCAQYLTLRHTLISIGYIKNHFVNHVPLLDTMRVWGYLLPPWQTYPSNSWQHIMSTPREGLLKIILENPNKQLTSGCGRRECFYLVLMAPLKAIALMPLSLAPTYPLIFLEQNTKSAVADQSCSQTVATTPKYMQQLLTNTRNIFDK